MKFSICFDVMCVGMQHHLIGMDAGAHPRENILLGLHAPSIQ